MPIVDSVIQDLRSNFGIKKIGIIGLCYGGYFCLQLAQSDDNKIDCFVTAHTKIRVPEDITTLKKPGFFICADNDHSFPDAARLEAEKLLSNSKLKYLFKYYPGTFHGFVTRGDPENEVIQKAKEDSLLQTKIFLEEQLGH